MIRARRRVETPPGAQAQVDWTILAGRESPFRIRNVASEWMRPILQKDINLDILHSESRQCS